MNIRKTLVSLILIVVFGVTVVFLYTNNKNNNSDDVATTAVYSSLADGNWAVGATWSPSGIPIGSDDITINNNVTYNSSFVLFGTLTINPGATLAIKNLDVKNGATLLVYGTLNVEDLTFFNGCHVHFFTGSFLNVSKDFENKNNSTDVVFDGTVVVLGEFKNENGGIITGSGTITAHKYDGSGTTYGYHPTDDIPDGATIPSPLPVQLLSFDVKQKDDAVVITWSTAAELNNNYFSVERSTDAANFTEIKQVKGAGNSNTTLEYTINDDNPLAGTSYYRLKQTDFDGKNETFKTVTLKYNSGTANGWGNVLVGPNPFATDFNLDYYCAEEGTVELSLYGLNGQVVHKEKVQAVSGNNTWHFMDNYSMKSGIYFITLVADGKETKTLKILKN